MRRRSGRVGAAGMDPAARGFATVDTVLAVSVVPVSAMVEVLYRAVQRGHQQPPAPLYADLAALGIAVEPAWMPTRSGRQN